MQIIVGERQTNVKLAAIKDVHGTLRDVEQGERRDTFMGRRRAALATAEGDKPESIEDDTP